VPFDPATAKIMELSRSTGIDQAHISRIFSGKSKPSLPLALTLAKELNITIDEFCESLGIKALTP